MYVGIIIIVICQTTGPKPLLKRFLSCLQASRIHGISVSRKKLSRKSVNVVVFPFSFHIAVQQPFNVGIFHLKIARNDYNSEQHLLKANHTCRSKMDVLHISKQNTCTQQNYSTFTNSSNKTMNKRQTHNHPKSGFRHTHSKIENK
jgi:hypothetical protein